MLLADRHKPNLGECGLDSRIKAAIDRPEDLMPLIDVILGNRCSNNNVANATGLDQAYFHAAPGSALANVNASGRLTMDGGMAKQYALKNRQAQR